MCRYLWWPGGLNSYGMYAFKPDRTICGLRDLKGSDIYNDLSLLMLVCRVRDRIVCKRCRLLEG